MKLINPHGRRLFGFSTSDTEIQDIIRAWAAVSLAFAIMLSRGHFAIGVLVTNFLLAAFTVGIGFLFHELCHKVVAQHYGCAAEFRAFTPMLVLAIALSFLGFIFAAPGAVMIEGSAGPKRNGHIAAAGPAFNFVLAMLFLFITVLVPVSIPAIVSTFLAYGYQINAWLGLFNMIPFSLFDGRKIFLWNKLVWGGMVAVGVMLMVVPPLL